ncbi:MAG: hypothetical protein E7328_01945 [Clostridiales bacterium]|nr:hypothetical protein [Clostridiales bacterium]
MKKVWYGVITFILCGCLVTPQLVTSAKAPEEDELAALPPIPVEQTVLKDESVYLTLNADGSVKETIVVSRIEAEEAGSYTDYGTYSEIVNLSGSEEPALTDDAIVWNLPSYPEGFYYQGISTEGKAPYSIAISYKVDGKKVAAKDMGGKKGKVDMTIAITPNSDAEKYFKENFMCQVQVPLDLSMAQDVAAPGAMAKVITGKTATLAYMAMPGTKAEYSLSFRTESFSMGTIQISCSASDVSGILGSDMNTIENGVKQLISGQNQIINGTTQLKDGLGQLSGGLDQLSDGANLSAEGSAQLADGLEQYVGGVNQLSGGFEAISDLAEKLKCIVEKLSEMEQVQKVLDDINAILNNEKLQQILDELAAFDPESALPEELKCLAEKLNAIKLPEVDLSEIAGYTDPEKILELLDQVTQLNQLTSAGDMLVEGMNELNSGLDQLADGLDEVAGQTSKIPGQVQQLINGQVSIRDGMSQAMSIFERFMTEGTPKVVSFAAPGKIVPRSVQFIMATDAIN